MRFSQIQRIRHFICLILFFLPFEFFSQEDIVLPQIITYIPSSLENKITCTKEEIQNQNYTDLAQLIESKGIQLLSYGPYGLEQKPSIRGFTDETVRVVIDGICVNNPQTGTFDFSTINLNTIEKIEIIKGGYTENTGDEDSVGGVIYITTKTQNLNPDFFSNTKLTTFFNKNTPLDTISQELSFSSPLTETLYFKADTKLTCAQNNFRENDAQVHDNQTNLQFTKYFGNGNYFFVKDSAYIGYKHIPGPLYSARNGMQKDFNNTLGLTVYSPNLSNYFTFKSNLHWISTKRFYNDSQEDSIHRMNSFKNTTTLDFYQWKNIKENIGTTIEYVDLNSTNTGHRNQFTAVLKETTKILISPVFSFNVPLAIKYSGTNFAFTPKMALSANFNSFSLTLDLFKTVQFPTMDDLYWSGPGFISNKDLVPENGFGGELILSVNKEILPLSVCVFSTYYKNKIQWGSSEDNILQPQNISSALYFGIDLQIEKSFFNNLLVFSFNGEYLYTRLLNKDNKYTCGKRIMWTPDFTASLSTTLNLNPCRILLNINYTGKRFLSNMNLSYLEPYFLVSLMCELTQFNHILPYVRIDNLLDTEYQSVENYPMPGTSLSLGIKVKL